MPFTKGHKLSGSRKGIPNNATKELREPLARITAKNVNNGDFEKALDELKESNQLAYAKLILEAAKIVLPKDITSGDKPIQFVTINEIVSNGS